MLQYFVSPQDARAAGNFQKKTENEKSETEKRKRALVVNEHIHKYIHVFMIYNTLDCVSIKIEKELAAANSALVDANKEIDPPIETLWSN